MNYKNVKKLIKVALEETDQYRRKYALEILGNIKDSVSVDSIISLLKDRDEEVSLAAAESLGEIRDRKAVKPLLYLLEKKLSQGKVEYWNQSTITKIEEAIINTGHLDIDLITPFIYKNEQLKSSAIEILFYIGDMTTEHIWIELLDDQDDLNRSTAARKLGKLKSKVAIQPLTNVLETNPYYEIRDASIEALVAIGTSEVVDFFIRAANERTDILRLLSLNALGKIGDKRAIDTLLKAKNDPDEDIQMEAIEALEKLSYKKR